MDVVAALIQLQVGFLLLAGLGETLLMAGNPAYLLLPAAKAVALLVFVARRSRRWARIALVVTESITLAGFVVNLVTGLLPAVTFSPTVAVLLTSVALPSAVIILIGRSK